MDTGRLPNEFPAYLEANRLARPRDVPHLRRWAQRSLDAPADPALAPDDRLRAFLAALALSPGVTDWQVRQAEDAVRLLRQFARERQSAAGGVVPRPPATAPANALRADEQGASATLTAAWPEALSDEQRLLRLRHDSPKTETAYLDWARRFAAYCRMRPPAAMTEGDVKRYLSHLAMERRVAGPTQNQALNALLFLFGRGALRLPRQ